MPILIYDAKATKPFRWPYPMDAEDITEFTFHWKPPPWEADKVYHEDQDIILPTQDTGFSYETVSGGVSGPSEPTWPFTKDEEVTDNGQVVFKTVPYDFLLAFTEVIAGSDWEVTTGVEVVTSTFNDYSTTVAVRITDDTLTRITLNNRITYGILAADRSIEVDVRVL